MSHKCLLIYSVLIAVFCSCKKETCNDSVQNQDELEVDCGGVCGYCSIEYPETGHYGLNILNEVNSIFAQGTSYSLHAQFTSENSLKVTFDNSSSDINNMIWWIEGGSEINYAVSGYDDVNGIQTFESWSNSIESDVNISFSGSGSALLEIYENGSDSPTKTKNISWN